MRISDVVPWIIFDIDGTVANYHHRQEHIQQDFPDWDAFFAASGIDEPLPDGVALALDHVSDGDLLWLTGRPERYRDLTTRWLHKHRLPARHLHMRPDDDLRPAVVFKAERVQQLATKRRVALIVDDDDLVVHALRKVGWPVQHARWMPR
jgi:hypothetical protein